MKPGVIVSIKVANTTGCFRVMTSNPTWISRCKRAPYTTSSQKSVPNISTTHASKPIFSKLPSPSFNEKLWNLIQTKQYVDAERLFSQLVHENKATELTFNNMIICLLRQNNTEKLEIIRTEMRRRQIRTFPKTASTVLAYYAKLGDLNSTISWFEQLKINRLPIDVFHVSSLLQAYSKSGRTAEMLECLMEWRDRIELDQGVYGTVLVHLASTKHVKGIKTVLELVDKHNIKLDRGVFYKVFHALHETQHFDLVKQLYHKMDQWNIQPDTPTYIMLMRSATHAEALQYWEDMKKYNIKPNIINYNAMLHICYRQGDTDRCLQLWKEIQSTTKPETITLNTMITVYSVLNDAKNVTQTFESFSKYYLRPDEVTYILLVKFWKRNNLGKAFQLMDDMEAAGITSSHPQFFKLKARNKRYYLAPPVPLSEPSTTLLELSDQGELLEDVK